MVNMVGQSPVNKSNWLVLISSELTNIVLFDMKMPQMEVNT